MPIENCNSTVLIAQFLSGFGSLINRKFFIDEFQLQYSSIIQQCQEDTDLIGAYHRAEKESSPPMFGPPATTSSLLCSVGLSNRISQINVIFNPQRRKTCS
jgi:hypothetical protein